MRIPRARNLHFRSAARSTYRPDIEILEDRLTPSTFYWQGGTSTKWENAANWTYYDGTAIVSATAYPGVYDDVELGYYTSSANDPVINADEQVSSLTTDANFTGHTLQISSGKTLTITTQSGSPNSTWSTGNIEISSSGGEFELSDASMAWSGGSISDASGAGGDFVIQSGTLWITGSADQLGANLWVGYASPGDETGASGTAIISGMTNDFTLLNGTGINVGLWADFDLSQADPTAGGNIVTSGSGVSTLDTHSYIYRNIDDSALSLGTMEHVDVKISMEEKGAIWLGAESKLDVNTPSSESRSIVSTGWEISMGPGSDLEASRPIELDAPTSYLGYNVLVSFGDATIGADLYLYDTSWAIDGYGSTPYATLTVNGDVHFEGGGLVLYVDGSTSGNNDSVSVSGRFHLNDETGANAALLIATDNEAPSSGYSYTIISAAAGVVGNDFASFGFDDTFDSYTTDYYNTSGPGGYTYYLSVP